ncbi:site-specific integrase [Paraburkholderia sp. SIMBA_049]
MLENYYLRPETVDRVRAVWIASAIEQYVNWLAEQHYTASSISRRISVLVNFGEFAKAQGATELIDLPDHVESFAQAWVHKHCRGWSAARRSRLAYDKRNPIFQMLRVAIDGYDGRGRPNTPDNPFERQIPQFWAYLTEEKGLRPRTMQQYHFHLIRFADYLKRIGIDDLASLSPTVISNFVTDYGPRAARNTLRNACTTLRVLLRYLYREGVHARDLSALVEYPLLYRYAGIPRSISWDQVEHVLEGIDRRSPCGKRDYAILLLLSTYGLRACEVAALTLDDIDWRNERLRIRDRKAGNTTTYPLSVVVGAAIIDYLKNGRPDTTHREVFMRMAAPLAPISYSIVVDRTTCFIRKAGIRVPRPGSHVLRHSCVQRLLNADFTLKHIGDYVGHRSTSSTQVYAKLAIEQLRELAQGNGEDVL